MNTPTFHMLYPRVKVFVFVFACAVKEGNEDEVLSVHQQYGEVSVARVGGA